MSYRVTIAPTIFTNARDNSVTYGVRVYDDYAKTYNDTWDSIPDDNMDVLRKVLEMSGVDDAVTEIFSCVQENAIGVYIGNTWYEWEDIKTILEDEE